MQSLTKSLSVMLEKAARLTDIHPEGFVNRQSHITPMQLRRL